MLSVRGVCPSSQLCFLGAYCTRRWGSPGASSPRGRAAGPRARSQTALQRGWPEPAALPAHPHAQCVRDKTGDKRASPRWLRFAPPTRPWEAGMAAPLISHSGLPSPKPRVSPTNTSRVVPVLLGQDLGASRAPPCRMFPQNT